MVHAWTSDTVFKLAFTGMAPSHPIASLNCKHFHVSSSSHPLKTLYHFEKGIKQLTQEIFTLAVLALILSLILSLIF
jgi:hypothetical protein